MSDFDPNFPRHSRDSMNNMRGGGPSRTWTLLIGFLVAAGLIAFLATGKQHDTTASNDSPMMAAPNSTNTTISKPAGAPTATLPEAKSPTETTGSGSSTTGSGSSSPAPASPTQPSQQ